MKFLVLSTILFIFCNTAIGQVNKDSTKAQTYDYYNHKSKVQRHVGIGLLAGGITITTVSSLIILRDFSGPTPAGAEAGIFTGLGMIAASVPLLLASDRNQRKAKRLQAAIKMQSSEALKSLSFQKTYYPAISLQLNL